MHSLQELLSLFSISVQFRERETVKRGGKNIPAALPLEWTSSVWQISHSAERNPLRLCISPAGRTPSRNTERLTHSADGACKQRRLQNTSCSHCHYLLDLKVTTRARFKLAGKIKAARTDTHTHIKVKLPSEILPLPNASSIIKEL